MDQLSRVGPMVWACKTAGDTATRAATTKESDVGHAAHNFGRRAEVANERSEVERFIG